MRCTLAGFSRRAAQQQNWRGSRVFDSQGAKLLIHDSWAAIRRVLSLGAIITEALPTSPSHPSCLAARVSRKGWDKRQNPGTSPTHQDWRCPPGRGKGTLSSGASLRPDRRSGPSHLWAFKETSGLRPSEQVTDCLHLAQIRLPFAPHASHCWTHKKSKPRPATLCNDVNTGSVPQEAG